jgi:hypothetical protein
MVDAVSASGNSYRAVSNALELRSANASAENRPAVAALAALALPQPVTTVSTPSDIAEDQGDLGFLYAPNGLPGISALSYAAPVAQPTTDQQVAAERTPGARLAIDSGDLNSLMSSFLTARTPSANPAPSPDVPSEVGSAQLSRTAQQAMIAQLYTQF